MRFLFKNKKKVFLITIILISTVFAFYYIYNNSVNHDALMIKEKYESSNNTYQTVRIDSNANITNIDEKEAVKTIKTSSGIIFIGYNKCEECRNSLNVLLEVLKDNNMELLYLDGEHLRDEYIIKNKKLKKTLNASKYYYNLLKLLDSYLDDYIIVDNKGNKYDTKEKRIELPTIIFISNKDSIQVYQGNDKKMNHKKLYNMFEQYINNMDGEVCTQDLAC